MIRRLVTYILLSGLIVSCGDSDVAKKSDENVNKNKATKEEAQEIELPENSENEVEEEIVEKVLLEEDSLYLYNELETLKKNCKAYCECMENAKSDKDCLNEFAGLKYLLEDDMNDRLPHEFKRKIMREASEIIMETDKCHKDF